MSIHQERSQQIVRTIARIKDVLSEGADVQSLDEAKQHLVALAAKRELFPESDFPWPTEEEKDRTYGVHIEEDGKFALYVDLVRPGVSNAPHDHGRAWALIASVKGQEKHHLFKRIDDGTVDGHATLERAGELLVEPGRALSMMVGGIHSIEATGAVPAMNLHCYAYGFEHQKGRMEFDTTTDTYTFSTEAAGAVEDLPLHPSVLS